MPRIAAYNAGAGRVRSKLDRKGKTFGDIASKLPSETQMYVPKLNAVLQLREGTTLEKLRKPFKVVSYREVWVPTLNS